MKISLEDIRLRWLFLWGIFLIAGCLFFLSAKVWLAARLYNSWDQDRLSDAARIEPTDADYWYRLGLYEKANLEHRDLSQAVFYYRRAVETNPRSDQYWMDLADAYEGLGQTPRAQEAFEKAQSAHPISSEVAWRYGNFLLRQKNDAQAFAEMRRALVTQPDLTVQAVSESSKAIGDVPRILKEVLLPENRYYQPALDYFVAQHQTDAALMVWDQMPGLTPAPEMPRIVPLINELIGQQQSEDAGKVWRQALQASGWPQNSSGDPSLVFNGGFEHEVLGGGFDWREDPVPGATFGSDDNVVHTGASSLRITFDGSTNLDFQNLRQFCPVEPKHHYHFAAYLRLAGISTDSGPRFAIYDPFHTGAPQILSPNLTGDLAWSLVDQDLITGPETHFLVIALRRVPSFKFDNKLNGTVWIDDVSLVPVAGEQSPR
jgi:tetratricopeptide (TPR) repeat protein